jgi:hypothetical protein
MEDIAGITAHGIADEMITLPGFLHLRRVRELVEQLTVQRFTIH